MAEEAGSKAREDPSPDVKPDVARLNSHDGIERDEEFNFLDGNISLRVESCVFFVHKYKLAKFRKIKTMVLSHEAIVLEGKADDFRNILRVMYTSSSCDSPVRFEVNASVLISTLRIATRYDRPQLRAFSTRRLELNELPILDCLPLAREFNISDWKTRALDHLVSREEPITEAEAEAELLGMKSFVAVVVRREERCTQQHKTSVPPNMETGGGASTVVPPGSHPSSNEDNARCQMTAMLEAGQKRKVHAIGGERRSNYASGLR
ncbi:hypothetical protein FRC06_011146, partial [Ceratobasidium sp. 370]